MSRETFEWERNMQKHMDEWYRQYRGEPDRSKSCKQFDVIVNGEKIEEKFLFTKKYAKMLVEMVQDMATSDPGWFYHVDADFLMWAHCPEDKKSPPTDLYFINWKELKAYVLGVLKEAPNWVEFQVCNKHYGITLNLPVSWDELFKKGLVKLEKFLFVEKQTEFPF